MQRRLTILLCLTVALILSRDRPAHTLVNGSPDFDYEAVGTILVHEPGHPRGDWGSFCGAFLIHARVLLTAGHCVQRIRAQLAEGVFLDARISLQQDPLNPATYVEGDPDASGWYAIDDSSTIRTAPTGWTFPTSWPTGARGTIRERSSSRSP
jgi:hypothetical protein